MASPSTFLRRSASPQRSPLAMRLQNKGKKLMTSLCPGCRSTFQPRNDTLLTVERTRNVGGEGVLGVEGRTQQRCLLSPTCPFFLALINHASGSSGRRPSLRMLRLQNSQLEFRDLVDVEPPLVTREHDGVEKENRCTEADEGTELSGRFRGGGSLVDTLGTAAREGAFVEDGSITVNEGAVQR